MNKKKLLVSLGLVTLVVAAVVGGTTAFFSDTEKSENNTFVAGSVDLKIDSECHYFQDGVDVGCVDSQGVRFGFWESTDLTTERFFAFDDVKPGDWGENTLSVTVDDNDAYVCMYIENAVNAENDRIDPEVEAGDKTDDPNGGELAANLHFTAWVDDGYEDGWQGKCLDGEKTVAEVCDEGEGDNVWQPAHEKLLFSNVSGPATDVLDGKVYYLGEVEGKVTNYLGVLWCAGELMVDEGGIHCNGRPMGNESQTDSLTADVRFYAEQTRNNPGFKCPPLKEVVFEYDGRSLGGDENVPDEYAAGGYNQPYVTWEIDGDEVELTFHNPTPWLFVFDVRVDEEVGSDRQTYIGIPQTTLIGAGPLYDQEYGPTYQRVVVDGRPVPDVHVVTQTFSGDSKIEVGLREGAERDWYIDWLVFNAVL